MNIYAIMLKPLFLLMIILSLLSFTGCSLQSHEVKEKQEESEAVKTVDSHDFETLLAKYPDAQLIDVRTAEEFQSGHLNHAHLIDFYSHDFHAQVAQLKKDEPVFVYCAVGGRSTQAAFLLQQQGFQQIINLEGGIVAWQQSGKFTKH